MNPIELVRLAAVDEKFRAIAKEKASMNTKIAQYTHLAVTLIAVIGVPTFADKWLSTQTHADVFGILVAISTVLHAALPSVFGGPSNSSSQSSGISTKAVIGLVLVAGLLGHPAMLRAQTVAAPAPASTSIQNLYGVGASWNSGGSPAIAGTALYAHAVAGSATYAFTAIDAVPESLRPFTVTSNIGVGVAQRVVTIDKIPIFVPTAVGISWTGSNTGWQWTGGGMAAIQVKANYYVLPSLRFLKSSVSGGSGYQVIVGLAFGWGK